jgi:Tfp pilus assembly protein PilN
MLSLLKKNPDASGGPGVRPWHPNFRNVQTLPDTKAVRTTFFINAIAALVAVGLLAAFGYQEYVLADLRGQVAQLDGQIERDKKPSQEAVALFTKFQAEEKKIQELETFLSGNKLVVSKFLNRLGKSVPAKISITAMEYNEAGVTLRGLVVGTPEQASGMISNYEKQLKADEEIGKRFDQIALVNLSRDSRDTEGGRLTFEISLRSTLKKEAKKP